MSSRCVVVVGGGIAGVATVAGLRAAGHDGRVVLIDRAKYPYDRPPLSKDYLAGTRTIDEILLQPPDWYEEQQVELVASAVVVAVRAGADSATVELTDGRTYDADTVVLATGGRAARPPIPGSESTRVHVLRDAEDADALRAALGPRARLLVIGGGLIGAEAASTARQLGCEVVVVDPLAPPMVGAVGQDLARWLHEQHTAHRVETVQGSLSELRETPTGITARLTGEDADREFDAVLMGVGMVPDTALAEAAGLEVDRGILVDERQMTSHPRILAVGDSARLRGRPRTEHWEAAERDGTRAAATILGLPSPPDGTHWFWSDRYHHHVEGVGEMTAPGAAHQVVVRGTWDAGPVAVFTLRNGRVIGAASVDDAKAVKVARRLIDRGIPVEAERLADPTTDLRTLLKG